MISCPECGHPTSAAANACTYCGHALTNGTVLQGKSPEGKPPPPAEVSGWVIHKTPPELIEWARQTFKEEEYIAALREVEQTGGVELKDFIHEIE